MLRKVEWEENNRGMRSKTLPFESSVLIGILNVARYFQNGYFTLEFCRLKGVDLL